MDTAAAARAGGEGGMKDIGGGSFATRVRAAFLAGATRRWHTNPQLCGTVDRVDGHAARVARLLLLLHPAPSIHLIRTALIHDDGEAAIGDVPGPAKRRNPVFTAILNQLEQGAREAIWGTDATLSDADKRWLVFCDRLDAWMWARFYGGNMGSDGWQQARHALTLEASALGLWPLIRALDDTL